MRHEKLTAGTQRPIRQTDAAVAHAQAIEQALADAGISLEQVHHCDGIACWAVNRRAIPGGTAYEPD